MSADKDSCCELCGKPMPPGQGMFRYHADCQTGQSKAERRRDALLKRIYEVAEKNMRPVAEMIVDGHGMMFSRGKVAVELVDDIAHCMAAVYESGVRRQVAAVEKSDVDAVERRRLLAEVLEAAMEWRRHGGGARVAHDYMCGRLGPNDPRGGANKADIRLLAAINAWTPRGDDEA